MRARPQTRTFFFFTDAETSVLFKKGKTAAAFCVGLLLRAAAVLSATKARFGIITIIMTTFVDAQCVKVHFAPVFVPVLTNGARKHDREVAIAAATHPHARVVVVTMKLFAQIISFFALSRAELSFC